MINHITENNNNTHVLTAFFYIKGSKDYPANQSISEPFGYEVKRDGDTNLISERPIFNASIRDIYINSPDIIEVSNNYSLHDDENNLIGNNDNITLGNGNDISNIGSKRPRYDRDQEFISTLLIKNSSQDEAYKSIFPNYDVTNFDDLKAKLSGDSTKPNYEINPAAKKYNFRTCVFWQKIFTLLEYLKKYENEIYIHEQGNFEVPEFFNNNWYKNPDDARDTIRNRSTIQKYLLMFIPYLMTSLSGGTSSLPNIIPRVKLYNPVRTRVIAGEGEDISDYYNDPNYRYSENENFINKYSTDIYLDQLWNKLDTTNSNTDGSEMMLDGLDIRIDGLESVSCKLSEHTGRIEKLGFKLAYRHLTDNNPDANDSTNQDNYERWEFNIYFDPDAFIAGSTTEKNPVWTYNDLDFDNEFRGPEHQYDITNPHFNKYDNDYANILVPNTEPDGTPILNSIHGKFVASTEEIERQMLEAILDKTKTGGYEGYVPFSVKRVSPYIDDTGEVVWDQSNSIEQKFYVFYKKTPPTSDQCMDAVRSYIDKLHSDNNNCHGEHRNADTGKVEFIGHDVDEGPRRNFLSKMYPTLFQSTTIILVPAYKTHCANGNSDTARYDDPTTYFSNTTPKRIHESITRTVTILQQFGFTTTGAPEASSSSTKFCPVEVFKVGSIEGDDNGSTSFRFDFPWYAVNETGVADNCLTTLQGFQDYKQKMFANNHDPESIVDLFQIIMILLTMKMFSGNKSDQTGGQHDPMKQRYGNIFGVPIKYESDNSRDQTITNKFSNVALFTLNSIEFKVYAQAGKDFGSTTVASVNKTSLASGY